VLWRRWQRDPAGRRPGQPPFRSAHPREPPGVDRPGRTCAQHRAAHRPGQRNPERNCLGTI